MDLTTLIASSTLADEIDFLAVRLFVAGTRLVNARLAGIGLRARPYAVLALACGPHPVRQRDLVAVLELDPSQIVTLLGELERAGLVRREPDPEDRRANLIRATDAGRELMTPARRITAAAELETLAVLAPDEREQLRTLLRKVVLAQAAERA